mmetsp:Transcript_1061/g.1967  ORF Transcript_1061/g.1967 Transcript_1061/m.1967 type:complete len:242 (+) Transcript_1061:78-803(+)
MREFRRTLNDKVSDEIRKQNRMQTQYFRKDYMKKITHELVSNIQSVTDFARHEMNENKDDPKAQMSDGDFKRLEGYFIQDFFLMNEEWINREIQILKTMVRATNTELGELVSFDAIEAVKAKKIGSRDEATFFMQIDAEGIIEEAVQSLRNQSIMLFGVSSDFIIETGKTQIQQTLQNIWMKLDPELTTVQKIQEVVAMYNQPNGMSQEEEENLAAIAPRVDLHGFDESHFNYFHGGEDQE